MKKGKASCTAYSRCAFGFDCSLVKIWAILRCSVDRGSSHGRYRSGRVVQFFVLKGKLKDVCSKHKTQNQLSSQDRLDTLANVQAAGISMCAGGIIGLGEGPKDRVGLIHQLATLAVHPESVPMNSLVAIAGTPMEVGSCKGEKGGGEWEAPLMNSLLWKAWSALLVL